MSNGAKTKIFPTAFLGFEKQVVLDYIYANDVKIRELEERKSQDVLELKAKLNEAVKELTEYEKKCEEIDNQYSILKAQLYKEKAAAEEIAARYEKLYHESEELAKAIKNKESEYKMQAESVKIAQERAAGFEERLRGAEARLIEKEKIIIDLSNKLAQNERRQMAASSAAQVQSGSQEKADCIIKAAGEKAETIISDAKRQAQETTQEIFALRNSMLNFREIFESKMRSFDTAISNFRRMSEKK